MKPLVSVIVPIYKVEKYLRRAVDSIINQTYDNLEIILVEDGSPDCCGQICDEYAKKDSRVQVIHKQNGGLSDARNAGLDVMTGEYVVFVDSDDYIAPYFISELYRAIMETEADVSFCQYAVVTKEDMSEEKTSLFAPQNIHYTDFIDVYEQHDLLVNMYDNNHQDATYFIVSWNKLYKASLWQDIRFPKGKIHEDEATTYQVFYLATRGTYVKTPMYGYFSAPSSITRDAFHLKRLDWMEALSERIVFFEERGETDLVSYGLRARADGAIKYYYPLKENVKNSKKQQKELKRYVSLALKQKQKGYELSIRTRIGYRIFLISPGLYAKLLNR